ncbi:glycerol dehydrogenase [Haloferax sulfurifontis]|uniref:Glycerol dehydrogenase n=1 Tax=Haloferax sulfurifontis TaxID=255616 RepID=A0A830DQI5_9EURY|nr:glycerol dehydrogenase [Haloferax sulfurifontis]
MFTHEQRPHDGSEAHPVIRTFNAPSAYVQGCGVLDSIGSYVDADGTSAVVLADETVFDLVGESLSTGLEASGFTVDRIEFGGACTHAEVARIAERAADADVVVGVGGGRALDTAKAVRAEAGSRLVTVPTIASTDAPTSSISVLYTEADEFDEFQFHGANPDLVVVDTAVVAGAPTRHFRSGMADAMATWFEADTAVRAHATNVFEGHSTRTAHAIARTCYETVREHGRSAVAAVERDAVTESVEAVVEANTLMSGIGFESGGLAAAHSVHDGLTQVAETHGATHGEKVNLGTLTQFVLEGRETDELVDLIDFSLDVGLPVTLADVGLDDPTEAHLRTVAEATCEPYETIHNEPFEVTPRAVRDALVTADELARERVAERR